MTGPLIEAAFSPLLQWRDPVYIIAGFAGIVALVLLIAQPLLVSGALPEIPGPRVHVWLGSGLVLAVLVHVAGLWVTSPPDVVDVLLFRSPTPFGVWGVTAMWAVFLAALLGIVRKQMPLRFWRLAHTAVTALIVLTTILHVWLIEGTMGLWSKAAICLIVVLALGWGLKRRRVWRVVLGLRRR